MIFQIFYGNHSLLVGLEELKTVYPRKFILSRMNTRWVNMLQARDSANNFFVRTVEFWRQAVGDRLLIIQIDSVICSTSTYQLQDFMKYDYIGAPWPYDWLIGGNYSYRIPHNSLEFFGGNGGLSIRSRQSMISCAIAALNGSYPHQDGFPEDVFFSSCLKYFLKNQNLPGQAKAHKFSVEGVVVEEYPWGCHKCWQFHSVDYLIRTCPDAMNAAARYTAKLGSGTTTSSSVWTTLIQSVSLSFSLHSFLVLTAILAGIAFCLVLRGIRRRHGHNLLRTTYHLCRIVFFEDWNVLLVE